MPIVTDVFAFNANARHETCVCSAYAHCSALTDGRLQRSRAWAMKKKVFTPYSSASLRPMALSVATALLVLSWLCMGKFAVL